MVAENVIEPVVEEQLYSSCLFCAHDFPPSPLFGRVPPGLQLAYDPSCNRLRSIFGRCRRWNLLPIEERYDAIDLLEHTVAGRALLLAHSDNVALYSHEELQIVRIGPARLPERATWRYGSYSARAAGVAAST